MTQIIRLPRFIPTCVGNMLVDFTIPAFSPVHPHVCGEHVPAASAVVRAARFIPTCVGNILHDTGEPSDCCRFIPTCVGNMSGIELCTCRFPVHPHVCGEHVLDPWATNVTIGSSPRVWGTLVSPVPRPRSCAVHPHVCGEHVSMPPLAYANCGSSPRVWGTFITSPLRMFLTYGSSPRVWGTCLP